LPKLQESGLLQSLFSMQVFPVGGLSDEPQLEASITITITPRDSLAMVA
jgi:hypothetical protein